MEEDEEIMTVRWKRERTMDLGDIKGVSKKGEMRKWNKM